MSPTAQKLLREFNRDIEREHRWRETKRFCARWAWLGYLAFLVASAWALRAWL